MKTIFVYENWLSAKPSLLGRLYVDTVRGGEIYAFEYDDAWLSNPAAIMLDPDLNLYKGRQYPIDKKNFGRFTKALSTEQSHWKDEKGKLKNVTEWKNFIKERKVQNKKTRHFERLAREIYLAVNQLVKGW